MLGMNRHIKRRLLFSSFSDAAPNAGSLDKGFA
jgi:hypothetical protein